MTPESHSMQGLLVGLLALRRGLIDTDQLLGALDAWLADQTRDLGRILREQGHLDDGSHALLGRQIQDPCIGEEEDPERTVAHKPHGPPDSSRKEAPLHPHAPPSADAHSPRFQILRTHARGGLGEVFLAFDHRLKRQVALKRMQAGLAGQPSSEARFLLEAELTARLEHPGIVPIHELARDGQGRPFYVMRFIQGETLRSAIAQYYGDVEKKLAERERELSFRRLLQSLVAACNAVAYAHSRGVVHRDLKPDNIMLGPFGETLVVDWGIAKPSSQPQHTGGRDDEQDHELASSEIAGGLTRAGTAIGTPKYMSPEQAAGDLDRVGPSSDIYGLGATLYCLLTGQAPFPDGSLPEILERVRRGIFPTPRTVNRLVDPTLEAICLKAMALEPGNRHTSALALGEEIEAWLADVRYRGEQVEALNQVRATLARLGIERAHHLFQREQHDQGMLWLARALESVPPSEPWLERAVRSSLGSWFARSRLLERVIAQPGEVLALSFSPDGRCLATATGGGIARLWDAATGHPLGPPLTHGGPVSVIAHSPDGRFIATAGRDGCVRLWDALTATPRDGVMRHSAAVTALRFGPDGTFLASAGTARDPCLWRLATSEPIHLAGGEHARVTALTVDPSGAFVATAREDGRVVLWDVRSGEPTGPALQHGAEVTALAFGPEGRELVTAGLDARARIWDLASRAQVREMAMPEGICQVEWCRVRNVIALACLEGTSRLWNPLRGQPIGEPLVHEGSVACLAFSPDGALLATGSRDATVRLWETGTGLPVGPPLRHHGAVHALAFAPDGRRLATGCQDGRARIWRVAPQIPGGVERIACWVRVSTGLDFDEADAIRKLDPVVGWELRRRLHELGGPPPRKIEKW